MLLQLRTCLKHHEYAGRHVPQVKLKTVTAECEQHPAKKLQFIHPISMLITCWRFVLTIKRHNLYHINLPTQPCFTFPSAIRLLTVNVIINEQADVFAGIQKGCIVEYMQSENIPVYLSTCAFLK